MGTQEIPEKQKLYTVGEICRLTGVTRKTLFYYDRIRLLQPTERIGQQNVKMYDDEKLLRLRQILEYREAGLNIAEIRMLLDNRNVDRLAVLLQAQQRMREKKGDTERNLQCLYVLIRREKGE